MSTATLSSLQIRSLTDEKWSKDPDAIAVGLQVTSALKTPSEVVYDFGKAQVVRADTVFQVRQALAKAEEKNEKIILLTSLQRTELGNDVLARLARCRLFAVDHWASLCAMFKAKELDRSICDPNLAQALMEKAPPEGYPPVAAGVLDAGTVWRALRRHVFEMEEAEPDLVSLLAWTTKKSAVDRYLNANDELRASLRQHLLLTMGEAVESILLFLESGAGTDSLALAIACQVVFGSGDEKTLDTAAARMEKYHGNKPIPPKIGRLLGEKASELIARLDSREDVPTDTSHLVRADDLLMQLGCKEHLYRNNLTRRGYEARLARFAAEVEMALNQSGNAAIERCEQLSREVIAHRSSKFGGKTEQGTGTEMAVRLLRWLSMPIPTLASFGQQVNAYRGELAFVDWAREFIARGGESTETIRAFESLDRAVLVRREQFNREFAVSLADWLDAGMADIANAIGVEDVLERVVAPIAEAGNKVLLVVLDGMSWPVCHELIEDFRKDHWFFATPDESGSPPVPVIATVPSVTAFSRTSLLSGRFEQGDASVEKRNFEMNPTLRKACDKKNPPLLFHKKEVTDGARGTVGEEIRTAIVDDKKMIVGVVINAIDDFLSRGDQMRMVWSIEKISPLRQLLNLARDSERIVILASDHGHVWHRPDAKSYQSNEGSRWRETVGDPREGELQVKGSRVREERGKRDLIVPWSESIYYGRQQNGYHGGISPQEMICPLVILRARTASESNSKDQSVAGELWASDYEKPDWWSKILTAKPIAEPASARPSPIKREINLFSPEPEPAPEVHAGNDASIVPARFEWVDRLMASDAYKEQKKLVRRHPPEDDIVRRCIDTLASNGDMMTPGAFAKAAGVQPARMDGLVAQIQRILNVDGYEILAFSRHEDRIELNVEKLKRQFDLE